MKILAITLLFFLLAPGTPQSSQDSEGLRFLCNELEGDQLCLPVLKKGCLLRKHSERPSNEILLPAEIHERVQLDCGSSRKTIRSSNDLVGFVKIETGHDALEYLRFFSSLWTVGFFEEKVLEIHSGEPEDCFSACLSEVRRQRLGLMPPQVRQEGRSFIVRRDVVRPDPSPFDVSAIRVSYRVSEDGALELVSEEALVLEREDQARLFFPMSM